MSNKPRVPTPEEFAQLSKEKQEQALDVLRVLLLRQQKRREKLRSHSH